jgi:hypothetical protein
MPAQAGTQSIAKSIINTRWVPAFAGMTDSGARRTVIHSLKSDGARTSIVGFFP